MGLLGEFFDDELHAAATGASASAAVPRPANFRNSRRSITVPPTTVCWTDGDMWKRFLVEHGKDGSYLNPVIAKLAVMDRWTKRKRMRSGTTAIEMAANMTTGEPCLYCPCSETSPTGSVI